MFLLIYATVHTMVSLQCSTTITVVNCKGAPVKGATATIQKCDGSTIVLKTDAGGIATSSACKKDICNVTVTAQIEGSNLFSEPKNCSGTDEDYRCKFVLCSGLR